MSSGSFFCCLILLTQKKEPQKKEPKKKLVQERYFIDLDISESDSRSVSESRRSGGDTTTLRNEHVDRARGYISHGTSRASVEHGLEVERLLEGSTTTLVTRGGNRVSENITDGDKPISVREIVWRMEVIRKQDISD